MLKCSQGGKLPVLNDSRKTRRKKTRRKLEQAAEHAPHDASLVQQALAGCYKVGVVVVSYRPRLLDRDNLVGAGKGIIDSLRYCGYLSDDDPDSVEAFYVQRRCPAQDERTEIYLFPYEPTTTTRPIPRVPETGSA